MATKKKSTDAKHDHTAYLKETVGRNHSSWIKENPTGTLADLLEFLREVQDELLEYDEEEVLAEIINDLSAAAEYLDDFDPVDEPFDGELPTVGYRLANVEEDIMLLEKLIEAVGEKYQAKHLPKPNRKAG